MLERSTREYQFQTHLLSGADLGEGRAALEEWVSREDPSRQDGRMDAADAAQKWSSGTHLSEIKAEMNFKNVFIPTLC